jgi:hypothetical protein
LVKSGKNWEEWGGHWFMARLLRKLIQRFKDIIRMDGMIEKEPLYRCMSWLFRMNRIEAREVLTMLARVFPGITFSSRGLRISPIYLERQKWIACQTEEHPQLVLNEDEGGESDEVEQ